MNIKGFAKALTLVAAAALLAMGIVGCSGGKVAATVGDVKIMEDDVTAEIQNMRTMYGMTSADAWGEYLAQFGYTPETLREMVIDDFVQKELVKKAAKENEITIDSSEVDSFVAQLRQNYESDDAWKKALESAGLTEKEYREQIENYLMTEQLSQKVAGDASVSDEELLNYVNMYVQYSYNGAKKSSHILFDAADTETAKNVLSQIKSGKISFEDAAKQYSKDGSAADGGNVGWDCLSSFVDEYQNALSALSAGQVSDLVTSQFGIHIIKCTEVFNAPEQITSLDQVPTEIVESIKSASSSFASQNAFEEWIAKYKEESNVVINPMPSGLPYDVDMSKYQTADASAAEGEAAPSGEDAAANQNENKEGSN